MVHLSFIILDVPEQQTYGSVFEFGKWRVKVSNDSDSKPYYIAYTGNELTTVCASYLKKRLEVINVIIL